METVLKPKRQVEPSEPIAGRKDKPFNLSLYQNRSQRFSYKSAVKCLIYREFKFPLVTVGEKNAEEKNSKVKIKQGHNCR